MESDKGKPVKIKANGKIWLSIGDESFLGQGIVELIENIKKYGSLRRAAGEMQMSYRKAWDCINKANKLVGKPLVILNRGGKHGGIAEITEVGEKVIVIFRQFREDFQELLQKETNSIEL